MLNKIYYIFFLCFVCFWSVVSGQSVIELFCRNNYTTINTISPDSLNYSDLDKLGESIGNARIVMLGEQSHGDANTFLAKTRLVKYLHEVKGFEVLAFEADFIAFNLGWGEMKIKFKNVDSIQSFLVNNIHDEWSKCKATENLYRYLSANVNASKPITITGFDNQPLGQYSKSYLVNYIDSLIKYSELPYVKSFSNKNDFIPLLKKFFTFDPSSDDSAVIIDNLLINYINTIQNQMISTEDITGIKNLVLMNLKSFILENKYAYTNRSLNMANKIRDIQMAENFKWLTKIKYPEKKIIVWAASYHIAKESTRVTTTYPDFKPMGEIINNDSNLRKLIYVLGFDSKEGKIGKVTGRFSNKSYPIPKQRAKSFENWLPDSINFAFINFNQFNAMYPNYKKKFFMQTLGHVNSKGAWNKMFDGIFYIKTMTSCIDYNLSYE